MDGRWDDRARQWIGAIADLGEATGELASGGGNVLQSLKLSDLMDVALDAALHPLNSLGCLIPDDRTPLAVEEFRNKAEVFSWVKNGQKTMALPDPIHYVPLLELVDQAYEYDPFPALWYVEGLGHYYADGSWSRGETQRHLLSDNRTRAVPNRSLTMLHAGMGLSYGDRLLTRLSAASAASHVRATVGEFARLCEANSRMGYTGAAFESLGLVAQVFHSDLVEAVETAVADHYPEILSYYWHGIGRGTYFSFRYFLPFCGGTARALHYCRTRSRHRLGQRNAVAGFAWGLAMVNLESPHVLSNLVALQDGGDFDGDAFSYGVWSAILMRQNVTPDASFIGQFLDYAPPVAQARRWERLVAGPAQWALDQVYGSLLRSREFERLFRYGGLA